MDTNYCIQCGAVVDAFFCSQCGGKIHNEYNDSIPFSDSDADEEDVIRYYFLKNYPYNAIVVLLEVYHSIRISKRTLKRWLKKLGLRRRDTNITDDQLREIIQRELAGPSSLRGYRGMWTLLKLSYGIKVQRDRVMIFLREIDPDGTQERRARRLTRRKYHSHGPNMCWHVDGYDKLKPYGLPIHGCIDGFSRKILWLKVARSNNNPLIPASFYIDTVRKLGFIPKSIQTDCGTEIGVMAAAQCYLREDEDAHQYGSSHYYQRIEAWWSFCKKSFTTWVIDYFQDMVADGLIILGHHIHMELVWFVYSDFLQSQLDDVHYQWNSHYICKSRHDTVPGIPDVLYFAPSLSGADDLRIELPQNRMDSLLQERNISEEAESCLTQRDDALHEFFLYVTNVRDLKHPPSNWEEAKSMYETIVNLCI